MDKIEVTQADIDAARDWYDNHTGLGSDELLEVAFARHRLATRADAAPVAWMPIESAPHACHVIGARLDVDVGEWIMQVVASPPIQPFTHWQPLPAAPDHIEEPRAMVPATDVAALVAALRPFITHNSSEEYTTIRVRSSAIARARQALTKGQNDE